MVETTGKHNKANVQQNRDFHVHVPTSQRSSFHRPRGLVPILLSSVLHKIHHPPRVTPLIIVPRDQLDKVIIQLDPSARIKDRRRGVSDKVGGDDRVLGVLEYALERAFGGLLDRLLDVVVLGGLLEADDEVDDGDVVGGDSEGETAVQCIY